MKKKKASEFEKIAELVKKITEQKYSERSAASALEEARRVIREKGLFIPKAPSKKGVRISF